MPEVGDYFISNNGDGPLQAKLLWTEGETARMKRWRGREYDKRTRVTYFEIPLSFLSSPRCGWNLSTDRLHPLR
jgi:hypothetical protein